MIIVLLSLQFEPIFEAGYNYDFSILSHLRYTNPYYGGPAYIYNFRIFKPIYIGIGKRPRHNLSGACIPADVDNAYIEYYYIEGGAMDKGGSIGLGIYNVKAGTCTNGICQVRETFKVFRFQTTMNILLSVFTVKNFVDVKLNFPLKFGLIYTPAHEVMGKEFINFDFSLSAGLTLFLVF